MTVWFPNDTPDECMKYVEELERALEESIKLQAHYAELLNMYDSGKRIIFKNSEEWKARLNITMGEIKI